MGFGGRLTVVVTMGMKEAGFSHFLAMEMEIVGVLFLVWWLVARK
jgi:hypothetical protein